MALQIVPHPGTVLLCDYELGRFSALPAEMTKRRPVVVLSPRRRTAFGPLIVVPLSTAEPHRPDDRHVRIAAGSYDFLRRDQDSWAKCEFVSSVSVRRLDRLRRGGVYDTPRLAEEDLTRIRRAVVRAIGGLDLPRES